MAASLHALRNDNIGARGFGRAGLRESVSQAAPILANLRDLARAEFRASTDALTALPNQRTVKDTVKRMAAHTYEP